MKKIALFATASIFSIAVMAQTESKLPTATKSSKSLSTKTRTETVPVKPGTVQGIQPAPTQTQTQPSPDEVIKMNSLKHDFGKIAQGKPVTYNFEITNISKSAIVVENATASCGCTTPKWGKEPILPGATAKIEVGYNAGNVGTFTKDVHIKLAGIDQPKTVTIVGEVLPAEAPKPNN